MSAGKHTPGPWVAKRLNEKDMREHQALWSISQNGLGWWLATVPACNPEQAGADAALIAAAPDLLEALRLAVGPDGCDDWWCPTCKEAVDGGRVSYSERHEDCGTFLGYQSAGWVDQARAAIAKARGE